MQTIAPQAKPAAWHAPLRIRIRNPDNAEAKYCSLIPIPRRRCNIFLAHAMLQLRFGLQIRCDRRRPYNNFMTTGDVRERNLIAAVWEHEQFVIWFLCVACHLPSAARRSRGPLHTCHPGRPRKVGDEAAAPTDRKTWTAAATPGNRKLFGSLWCRAEEI